MGEVVYVQPKERTLKYKRHNVVVRYIPDDQRWYWEFSYNVTRTLHGFADSFAEAEKHAKQLVDQVTKKAS